MLTLLRAPAIASKKDKKKGGKKKKGGAAEEELVVPDVFLPEALVGAPAFACIRYEAYQLRQRLAQLETLARRDIEAVAARAAAVFDHLQERTETRFAREGAAVEAFVREARTAIEAEATLPLKLRLEGEYFIVSKHERVLPEAAQPQPLVVEHVSAAKLAPSHVATLASALRSAAAASSGAGAPRSSEHGRRLPRRVFIEVVRRLAVANKLPSAWASADDLFYQRLAHAFDEGSTGLVDWRRFVFAVARFSLPALADGPTVEQLEAMRNEFVNVDEDGQGRVAPSACNTVTLWFELLGDKWRPDACGPSGLGHGTADGSANETAVADDFDETLPRDDEGSQIVSASAAANLARRAFLQGWSDSDGLVNFRRVLALWSVGERHEDSLVRVR